ncbi:MAG TPA: hypothetical protein VGR98_22915 [Streptosporangiaceae bacterium]|nr:hypothetical protein [Streptosporangiaceae bacterium]
MPKAANATRCRRLTAPPRARFRDIAALALLTAGCFAMAAWRLNARLRPPRPRRR